MSKHCYLVEFCQNKDWKIWSKYKNSRKVDYDGGAVCVLFFFLFQFMKINTGIIKTLRHFLSSQTERISQNCSITALFFLSVVLTDPFKVSFTGCGGELDSTPFLGHRLQSITLEGHHTVLRAHSTIPSQTHSQIHTKQKQTHTPTQQSDRK